MSTVLWYGAWASDAGVDIGNPLDMYRAMKELGILLEDESTYDELQSIPEFAEQEVTPFWLESVLQQAQICLQEHGGELTSETKDWLGNLIQAINEQYVSKQTSEKPQEATEQQKSMCSVCRKDYQEHI